MLLVFLFRRLNSSTFAWFRTGIGPSTHSRIPALPFSRPLPKRAARIDPSPASVSFRFLELFGPQLYKSIDLDSSKVAVALVLSHLSSTFGASLAPRVSEDGALLTQILPPDSLALQTTAYLAPCIFNFFLPDERESEDDKAMAQATRSSTSLASIMQSSSISVLSLTSSRNHHPGASLRHRGTHLDAEPRRRKGRRRGSCSTR